MEKNIDCLIIGHNSTGFTQYVNHLEKIGKDTGAYRDLNLNYILFNDKPYHASQVFNMFCRSEKADKIDMFNSFSNTIAYLGTYLNKNNLSFDYIESFNDEKNALAYKLQHENILTIAISTTYYVSVLPIVEIIDFIKEYNKEVKIIVGGPFIETQNRLLDRIDFKFILTYFIKADFCVISNQGELTLVNIINALKNNLPFTHLKNTYYLSNNEYIETDIQVEDNKLSENLVNWELFSEKVKSHIMARTSISCAFKCSFCGFPEHAGQYQTITDIDIEKEFSTLSKLKQVKGIFFIDDTFNVPMKRFKEILKLFIKNKYQYKWHSYFRCQFADDELVRMMKDSGCEGVYLGIESGSDEVLKNMNKNATIRQYSKGIELLNKYGITTHANFMIGFPGETEKTIKETIDFITNNQLDFYRAQLWYNEHITPIWQRKEEFQIEGEGFEWKHKTMDSKIAMDWVEQIFLTINTSVWMPQYNFNFFCIWQLIHQGIEMKDVKNFINLFNRAVKERLVSKTNKNISQEIILKLKEV